MDCVFCTIVNRELDKQLLYEDEKIIAFKDIQPVAPVHLLIVPKKHIPSIEQLMPEDKELIGEMFWVARKMAKEQGIRESGYRLSFQVGKDAGQTVDHLHLHLMGGKKLSLEGGN